MIDQSYSFLRNRSIIASLMILSLQGLLSAREDFISSSSRWHYSNGETVPDAKWKERDFDDSSWLIGQAPLGYGKTRLRTIIRSTQSPRPITSYFRSSFIVNDPSEWESLLLEFKFDDGAVIYLNGQKLATFNMPAGPFDSNTRASQTIRGWIPTKKLKLRDNALSILVKGKNTIAVSVHQATPESSDLRLIFSLTGVEKGIKSKEIITPQSPWNYSDQAQLPDDDWATLDYDDQNWKTGKGVFGYGNDDVETTLEYGPDPSNKPICAWFRKEFQVDQAMDVRAILMTVRFDDAATFYLNGKEVERRGLPFGYSDHRTLAGGEFSDWSNKNKREINLPAKEIFPGKNVIAVQIHGASLDNPDMCFAMISLSAEYLTRKTIPPVIAKNKIPKKSKQKPIKVSDKAAVGKASPMEWAYSTEKYLAIALSSYEKKKFKPAQRAYVASRWAEIFSAEGAALLPDIKAFLLAPDNLKTAQSYLDLYSNYDDHQIVYEILNTLYKKDPAAFRSHANLAFAIALVYDQEPPDTWPHYQVNLTTLPRQLPDPIKAFQFWVKSSQAGKCLHPLNQLSMGELKYVVDTPASLEELEKAQKLRVRLSNIQNLYPGIEYSHERLKQMQYQWPHPTYTLDDIKREGGICVDQAYYTAQIAKAYGVPAMMVSGPGSNGNHAWVGFLDQRERWNFETGRYEESKFVTGITFDPQTWQQLTDHQLTLLTERFQNSPRYQISQIHSNFAKIYLDREKIPEAIGVSKLAIKSEPRNFAAWELLVKAQKKGKTPEKELLVTYQNGARAFSRIADLEAHFLKRQVSSLIQQGQVSDAEKIRARIISRNRRERPDLALEEAKQELEKLTEKGNIEDQIALYKRQVQKLKGAGLITYYGLTQPFLEHLMDEEQLQHAQAVLEYTERKMEFKEDSQLAAEFQNWKSKLSGQ